MAVRSRPRPDERRDQQAAAEFDQVALKARVAAILNRWPAVGLAVGVVRDGLRDQDIHRDRRHAAR
jgi:hypothetical protein